MKQIAIGKDHAYQIFIEELPFAPCSTITLQKWFTTSQCRKMIKNPVIKNCNNMYHIQPYPTHPSKTSAFIMSHMHVHSNK